MSDWGGDSDDGEFLEALEEAERTALARRQQTTAPAPQAASTGPPSSAQQSHAQPPQQQQQQQQQHRDAGPPRTPAELCRRCQLFCHTPLPPPRPSQERCPGVYGRGCGGDLKLVRWGDSGTIFWACSKYPDCAYREFPPPRKLTPELSIALDRHQRTLVVAAVPGAEDAVSWCGGVPAVLRVAGVDLRRALSVPAPPPAAAPPAPAPHAPPPTAAPTGPAAPAAAAETALQPAAEAGDAAAPEDAQQQLLQAGSSSSSGIPSVATAGSNEPAAMDQEGGSGADQPATADAQPAARAPQPAHPVQGPVQVPPSPPQPVVFPLHEYERLSSQLQQFSRQFRVCLLSTAGMIPPATLRAARGMLRTLPSPDQVQRLYACMPPFLEAALLPFQREGVLFGLARGGRCLIADEMGVGKTVQAIALASCYQGEWPLLIVVPASLRLVWAEELEKWLPHLRPTCIHVIEGKEDRVAQGSVPLVTITSYEMMQRLTCDACKGRGGPHHSTCAGQRPPCRDPQNCMASLRWQVVIVDESHTLRTSSKPPDALHTEAVVSAIKRARRAILLTGTPSLSRPFDLFRQVDAVMPGLLGRSRIEFAAAYCNRREVPLPGFHAPGERCTRMDVSGLSRGAELHDMLKAEVMLRRLKRDVLSQLPPKRRQVIRLPKPPASEWPKLPQGRRRHSDDSEGSASSGEEDEGDGEEGEDAEGEGPAKGHVKHMSAAHRTGLAKASSVIDWLMTALGVRSGKRGAGGSNGAGRACGQGGQKAQGSSGAGAQLPADDDDGADSGEGDAPGSVDAPKFLVFAHHKTVMNRLAAALEGAAGYSAVGYVRIDGSTDPEDRRIAVRRFRSDTSVRVALLSVAAAGVGLDFSAASVVVFAELPDEVALVRQAEDRAHRQGQSQPVNVYFLCAKGTTDDRRWQHLNRSLARVAAVHDGAGLPVAAAHAPGDASVDESEARRCSGEGLQAALAMATQAGLVVECVHDAELVGLTPAAAKAGMAAGQQGATQTGESPLPTAAAAAAAAAPDGHMAGAAEGHIAAAAGAPAFMASSTAAAAAAGAPGVSGTAAAEEADNSLAAAGAGGGSPAAHPAVEAGGSLGAAGQAEASQAQPEASAAVPAGAPVEDFPAEPEQPVTSACGAASATTRRKCGPPPSAAAAGASKGSPPGTAGRRLPTRGRRQACLVSTTAVAAAGSSAAMPASGAVPSRPAAAGLPALRSEPVEVWFEVSGNSNRVHLHGAADGSAPLRLSLPMEALLADDSPTLEDLLEAVRADGLGSGSGALPGTAVELGQQQQQADAVSGAAAAQQQLGAASGMGAQQQQQQQHDAAPGMAAQQQQQQQHDAAPGMAAQQQQQQQQHDAASGMAVAVTKQVAAAGEAGSGHAMQGHVPCGDVHGQQAQAAPPPPLPHQEQQPHRPAVVGGIGVLALDRHISAAKLAAMLAEAREFAVEWRELRGLHQSRLQGRVLRAPLQEAVEEVDQAAAAAGKLGTSTSRFVDAQQRADLALPPAADWRMVRVLFKRYAKECQYQQPFMPDGSRLCINCAKPVPGKAAAQPAETVLDGMSNLFCSGECEGRFGLKSNGSAYRRALFKLERGICVMCRLDCHTLVKRLQAVEKGSRGWEEQRRRIIAARAPRLMGRGYKAHLDLLVRRAVEGNAWQADHILPVYKGGGLCDVDNLRTLCVACHADVTKEQVKERAARRQQEKAAKATGGGLARWLDVEREVEGQGEGGAGQPLLKRRKRLQKLFCDADESDDAECWPAPAAAAAEKAGAAAAVGVAAAGVIEGPAGVIEGLGNPAQQPRLRPRARLKPLFIESEDAEVGGTSGVDNGGTEQPPAAAVSDEPVDLGAAEAAGAGAAGAAAAGAAADAQAARRTQQRPRPRLKPLFVASEDAEVGDAGTAGSAGMQQPVVVGEDPEQPAAATAAAATAAAAADCIAAPDQPSAAEAVERAAAAAAAAAAADCVAGIEQPAARAAGAGAAAAAGAKPAPRARLKPRSRLQPVFIDSESEAESPTGAARARTEPQPRLHRLARSSTADEPPPPPAATGRSQPLGSGAANARAGSRGSGATKKRPRNASGAADAADSTADGSSGSGASRPKLERRARGGGKVVIDDGE